MSFLPPLRQFIVLLVCILILIPSAVIHAQANNAAGVGLSPATIEGPANPGDVQNHTITVTNLSPATQTYYLVTKDITGVQEGGVPIFADPTAEKTGYELTDWLSMDNTQVTLDPGQSQNIQLTITVPENATPGSHFGGIFVSVNPPKLRSTGAAIAYEVAEIVSIRIAGDAVENTQIRSFSTTNFIYTKPEVNFMATVDNKGNVLENPYGPLEIYNMFGKRVSMTTFNDSKAGIFPKTSRDFTASWKSDGPGFGRYQAILSLVYGEQGHLATISSTVTFWILPMNIILPALGILAFLLLAAYIAIRMYVNKTVRSMSGGTRRIVRRRKSGGMSALLLVTVVMLAITALFLIALLALFA